MSSGENRESDAALAEPLAAAGGADTEPNPPLVCPKPLLPPGAAGSFAPKPLPNPPPPPVEEKVKPAAELNPEEAAGVLEVGAAKEKEEAETADEGAGVEPKPAGGCDGANEEVPKPVEEDGAAEEPNPLLEAAKLKVLAWTGAGAPKPTQEFRMNRLII